MPPAQTSTRPDVTAESPKHTPQQAAWLAHAAVALGLDAEASAALMAGNGFVMPPGLPCRLLLSPPEADDAVAAARAVVVLPLDPRDLAGTAVLRLLRLQAALMAETGWWLGTSDEGLLQLASVGWVDTPAALASAFAVGHALAGDVAHGILYGDEA